MHAYLSIYNILNCNQHIDLTSILVLPIYSSVNFEPSEAQADCKDYQWHEVFSTENISLSFKQKANFRIFRPGQFRKEVENCLGKCNLFTHKKVKHDFYLSMIALQAIPQSSLLFSIVYYAAIDALVPCSMQLGCNTTILLS